MIRHPYRTAGKIEASDSTGLLIPMNKRFWIEISSSSITDRDHQLSGAEELRNEEERSCESEFGVSDAGVEDRTGGGVERQGPGEKLEEMDGDDAKVKDDG